jgi:hypothetical protein
MSFEQENQWLASIRLSAESGGESGYFDNLQIEITNRKNSWKLKSEGGEFNRDELAKLIQTAHHVLQSVERERARHCFLPTK